ncbi:MAG: NADH-quinone oxidoreductase subunit NuoB [Nitrososphaeria archaeon]
MTGETETGNGKSNAGGNGKAAPLFSRSNMYVVDMDEMVRRAKGILAKGPVPAMVDWANAFSLWPVHLMTSCCGCEIGAAWGPRFDNERYGSLPWISPRQTNLIIIEGTVTRKMACSLRITWEQMPYPKFAIAMGVCALDGGLFYNSYNIVRPWQVIPVDIYIPGCPPRPEAVARSIVELQRKIREEGVASRWLVEGEREDLKNIIPKEDLCGWRGEEIDLSSKFG